MLDKWSTTRKTVAYGQDHAISIISLKKAAMALTWKSTNRRILLMVDTQARVCRGEARRGAMNIHQT